jgi:palmitoyltransferase ZDHHC9/14/18
MENKSDVNQAEEKPQKCVFIGKKYYFKQGKYAINPKSIGLPISLIVLIYNFIHISYYMNKFLSSSSFAFLLIINIILFTMQILQSLNTALTDPGSYLPDYWEDKSNNSDAKIMLATIKGQEYFLKFCRTCLIAKDLRVYHCPDCGLCILRHDHHCPWLSNCIGLNNHHLFFYLVIINVVFFVFNFFIILNIVLNLNEYENEELLSKNDKVFAYVLLVLNIFLLLFNLALLIVHIIYMLTGQTTNEKVKRKRGAINPFSNDSKIQNAIEFWKYPMRYRERIEYNDAAKKYLDTNLLICDYLSGSYYMSPDKKIISETLVNKGYSYNKSNIELIDKSSEGGETSDTVKLDEQNINDGNGNAAVPQ